MMPATVLAAPFKASAIGTDVYVGALPVNLASPTRTELNAMTNINLHLDKDNGLSGFELTPNTVMATDLGTGIGYPQSDGDTYGTGTIGAFLDPRGASHDLRSVMSEGDALALVIFDKTDTAGSKMDVFAITVRAISKSRAGVKMLSIPTDINNSERDVTVPA
jgi:hypothetical protein